MKSFASLCAVAVMLCAAHSAPVDAQSTVPSAADTTAAARATGTAVAPGASVPMMPCEHARVKPRPRNTREFIRTLERRFPPMLRSAGHSGGVLLRVVLTPEGFVTDARVTRSSGMPEMDAAALDAVTTLTFTPALFEGQAVRCWLDLPVSYAMR